MISVEDLENSINRKGMEEVSSTPKPEQISASLTKQGFQSQPSMMQLMSQLLRNIEPAQNVGAGLLQGGKEFAGMLPGINPVPEQVKQLFGNKNMDPYANLGVERQQAFHPETSSVNEAGLQQLFGEQIGNLAGLEGAAPLIKGIGKAGWKMISPAARVTEAMQGMSKGKSLEEAGKDFSKYLRDTFTKYKEKGSKKYKNIFGKKSKAGGDIGSSNVDYDDFINPKHLEQFDPEIAEKYQIYKDEPSVRNLHELQSDLAGEERYYEKMVEQKS